jgi:hypothetical protein
MARLLTLILAVAGCALLVVGEFSTLYSIQVITVIKESTKGGENHGYALLIIAVAAAFMAYGGIVRGARPAQYALLILAIAALFVVFAIDYPDVDEEGFIGVAFERAKASPKNGFYFESLGAVILLLASAAALAFSSGASEPRAPSDQAG